LEYLYLVCVLISLGMLFWLKMFDVRKSTTQFLNILVMLLSNLGFYFMAVSKNLEEALLAQKLAYFGGVFLPVLYFIMVLEICHVELNKTIPFILMGLQCVVFGFVCTMGASDIFYKSAAVRFCDGVLVLDKVYGPLHVLLPVTMYGFLFGAFCVAIYSLIKKKSVDRHGVFLMLILATVAAGAYAVEKIFHFEHEIIPVVYLVLMTGTLFPIYDSNIFTVYENTDIIKEQLSKVGFLTFDIDRRYKGCDDFMEDAFPELKKYHVGERIDNCSRNLQELISQISKIETVYDNSKKKRKHIHVPLDPFIVEGIYYTGEIHGVQNPFGKLKGYTIELRDDTEHYQALQLTQYFNEELAIEVREKTKKIRAIQQKVILGMAQMVESRDLSTGGHIKRTSDVVRIFAEKLLAEDFGLKKDFLDLVIRSAPMHDIGKIGVDDDILRKQGRFTDEEYAEMKKHAEIGYRMVGEILSDVEEPEYVRVAENVAHFQHEKVNGTGYPTGIKGEEIPIEARIMALADVFDALVSKRCYKDAYSYDKAFSIIEKDAGSHFDAELAKVFLSCRKELEEYYNKSEK